MGKIITFPRDRLRSRYTTALANLPAPFSRDWQEQHLPLIDAAMDLMQANDAEFERRCQLMADKDGRSLLNELSLQLGHLGSQIADVADALLMTAMRIRTTMARQNGCLA